MTRTLATLADFSLLVVGALVTSLLAVLLCLAIDWIVYRRRTRRWPW